MAKVTVDVINSSKIKTFIELVNKYKDELPEELRDSIKLMADHETFEYGKEEIALMVGTISNKQNIDYYSGEFYIEEDDVKSDMFLSVNPILKRVTKYAIGDNKIPRTKDGSFVITQTHPKKMKVSYSGVTLIEWG